MPHGHDDAGLTSRGLFLTAALPPPLTTSPPPGKDTWTKGEHPVWLNCVTSAFNTLDFRQNQAGLTFISICQDSNSLMWKSNDMWVGWGSWAVWLWGQELVLLNPWGCPGLGHLHSSLQEPAMGSIWAVAQTTLHRAGSKSRLQLALVAPPSPPLWQHHD